MCTTQVDTGRCDRGGQICSDNPEEVDFFGRPETLPAVSHTYGLHAADLLNVVSLSQRH